MTSKGKLYRQLRKDIMYNCIVRLIKMMSMPKERLDFIPLVFLKNLEQELSKYENLLNASSKIPEKKDISSSEGDESIEEAFKKHFPD